MTCVKCVHRPYLSYLPVISYCCKDEKVGKVKDKVDKENLLSKSIPLLFKQSINRLNMKHLKTVLKQDKVTIKVAFNTLHIQLLCKKNGQI